MESFLEVKDDVARQRGFNNWTQLEQHEQKGLFESSILQDINDQVATTYSQQFVDALRDVVKECEAAGSPVNALSYPLYLKAVKLISISRIK